MMLIQWRAPPVARVVEEPLRDTGEPDPPEERWFIPALSC